MFKFYLKTVDKSREIWYCFGVRTDLVLKTTLRERRISMEQLLENSREISRDIYLSFERAQPNYGKPPYLSADIPWLAEEFPDGQKLVLFMKGTHYRMSIVR